MPESTLPVLTAWADYVPTDTPPASWPRSGSSSGPAIVLVAVNQNSAPRPMERTMPKVEVATVGRVASSLVGLVCLFSIIIGTVTGFYLIFLPVSILAVIATAGFYGISLYIERDWRKTSGVRG